MDILSRKYLPPILGLATLAWLTVGTMWFDNRSCTAVEPLPKTPISNALAVRNDRAAICFAVGETRPILFVENIAALKTTAEQLRDNADKSLIIKGLYSQKETQSDPSVNLGLQRAEAVSSVLTTLGAPNSSLKTTSERRDNLVFDNQKLCDGVEFALVEEPNARFQAVNFYYGKNKFRFAESGEVKTYFEKLSIFLSKNPNAQLKITANRDDTEGSKTASRRLAFAREFLENHHFSEKQFVFENKKNVALLAASGSPRNRRLEIRIIIP